MNELNIKIVQAAIDMIKEKKHWCQWAHARTEKGEQCHYTSKSAYQFCGEGAIFRASLNTIGYDTVDGAKTQACENAFTIANHIIEEIPKLQRINDDLKLPEHISHIKVLEAMDIYLEKMKAQK